MQMFHPDGAGRYAASELQTDLVFRAQAGWEPACAQDAAECDIWLARICILRDAGEPARAALLCRDEHTTIVGRLALPLLLLRRGDEIRVAGHESVFFTDEAPLRIAPLDQGAPAECARCHGRVAPGDLIVRCPCCGALYMAQPDQAPNCWEFGPCVVCGRDPRALFVWQPEPHARPRTGQEMLWPRSQARSSQPLNQEPRAV